METINIHQAKTQLSRLIERVNAGEEIVIAKAGRPVARLVPATASAAPRKPGLMKGRIRVSKDFDAPLPHDLLDAFEGKAGSRRCFCSRKISRSPRMGLRSSSPASVEDRSHETSGDRSG